MFEPLSEATKAYYQAESDAIYSQFVGAVARGRETTPTNVKANFGKGRVIRAAEAKKLGMVDRLETSDAAFSRLGLATVGGLAARAEATESAPAEAATDVSADQPSEPNSAAPPATVEAIGAGGASGSGIVGGASGPGGAGSAGEAPAPAEPAADPAAVELETLRLVAEL
jgi:ClpP class serine protease